MGVIQGIGYLAGGFIVASVVGMFAHWFDRKITARVQWRVGPPLFQPLYDFVKLLAKEVVVPEGASRFLFLSAPLFGLAATTVVSALLLRTIIAPGDTFIGDLIVVIYLLTIPSQAIILGSFASANPLASLGGSREMKLILSYELPFLLVVLVPVIKAGGTIRMGEILQYQATHGAAIASISGVIAFLIALICMQAKLAKVPFDAPEAETEIMGGAYIEYSGAALGLFKLTQWMMMYVVPLFLMMLFIGAVNWRQTWWNLFFAVLIYIGILLFITLVRNTNARLRIDQIMKFFWARLTPFAVIAVILAFLGL
ncbi:MAG: NADH-quinone oxidoreductase subunit H [bacterium]|jgi:NADH-quinone oxidoreductase subunit H